MATQTIKTLFQFRRASTSEWEIYKDVVPAAGEPCFDLTANILKIGNGIDTYEHLKPINGVEINIAGDGKSVLLEDGVFKLAGFDAAEVGAQPRKNADGSIEWVVPSTDELDGLKTRVETLETSATTLLGKIEGLEQKVDGVGEGTVDEKINTKIDEWMNKVTDDGTINTIQELVTYVANHGSEVATIVADIVDLQDKVGEEPVRDQIIAAIQDGDFISREEAESTLLSKIEATTILQYVKYNITDVPKGTLIDYREKEIRVMCPANTVWSKQAVGEGGDANCYYATFNTYAPNDTVVGYIEHLNGQSDSEILTSFSTDTHGRRYQTTWLAIAQYDDVQGWTYYGKESTANKYVGYDYQIDWYDADGIIVASDKIRINLSNEDCYHNIEPYYTNKFVKEVTVNGEVVDVVDGKVDIVVPVFKGSDEIEVAEDGTLSIKAINLDKVVQDTETIIVMDGGSAV